MYSQAKYHESTLEEKQKCSAQDKLVWDEEQQEQEKEFRV